MKPSVTTNDGATFAPTLRLALTPVQLTLTGAAASLLVQDVTTDQPVLTARTLGRTGMTVATARTVSVSLALAVLVAVLAFLRTARRTNPTSETPGTAAATSHCWWGSSRCRHHRAGRRST